MITCIITSPAVYQVSITSTDFVPSITGDTTTIRLVPTEKVVTIAGDAPTYNAEAASSARAAQQASTSAQQSVIDASNASRLEIGVVTTLDAGQSATASIVGPAGSQLLNLALPKGYDGVATIGGYPFQGTDLQPTHHIEFAGSAWVNVPKTSLTDGGNF